MPRLPTILSVILPASNEADEIAACLRAVLHSNWRKPGAMQVIVVANGCTDDTAARARALVNDYDERGWLLQVIERQAGGKLGALNAGDAAADGAIRVYLDADVTVSPNLIPELHTALDVAAPRYASGKVIIIAPKSWVSQSYARIWRKVPFMARGVPGCGVFAVNAAGRARWGAFPDIISDDTFVRLSFKPEERIGVPAPYDWPIARGFANLVKVRRRQDAGVRQIAEQFPDLLENDDKDRMPRWRTILMALDQPLSFAIYCAVAVAVKLRPPSRDWSRGR